jgi:hypothetical protein
MSAYTVIDDIANTMINLIRTNTEGLIQPDQISSASPADITEDNPPRLSLFLYQIGENRFLKNQGMQQIDPKQSRFPPLSLNLYYLLTAYALTRTTEQQIIGRVMQIFHDNSVIRGSLLKGSLSGTTEEISVALNPLNMDEMNKLWSMFGARSYRLSVTYQVSPALIDSTRITASNRVIERYLNVTVEEPSNKPL